MHTTSLRKVGGSVMVAIPQALLEILQWQPVAKVDITWKAAASLSSRSSAAVIP